MSWDRIERLLGQENLQRLTQARVVVAGLGSGGGYVALSLAMSGVGNFVLVDNDVLEETNIVRHVADRRYLGWNKAQAVADLIRQRNPNAKIEVREGHIEDHLDVLDNADLLIGAVDGEQTKYSLNQACLPRNLTAIYAGVYERGEGGDVVVIRPYHGPCYACWAAELREGLFQPTASEDLDYGMVGPDGTLEAEPGLWLHVAKVASIQTDFAINELLAGSPERPPYPANTIILANATMEILDGEVSPPHSSLWVNIARDPHCLVCGDEVRAAQDTAQMAAGEQAGEQVEQSAAGLSLDDLAGDSGISIESQKG
jgi:molybdopterin/thiamine biosynthesis adenylyltransferase